MSCFLKVSYHNKHKKYRYYREKPINFSQIRKQLSISHPAHLLRYQIQSMITKINQSGGQQISVKKKQEEVLNFIRNIPFQENSTLKIRVLEQLEEQKKELQHSANDSDSLCIPTAIVKIRSKSEDIELSSAAFIVRTDQIELTQSFLCNSVMDYVTPEKNSEKDWIEKTLFQNQTRMKRLQQQRRLTNTKRLYQFIEAHRQKDGNQNDDSFSIVQ